MGWGLPTWLGGSDSAPQQPAAVREKSKDGGYIAPDRGAREMCYESRDVFFDCLDKHDILDAVKHDEEARRHCGKEHGEFERDCARSWVSFAVTEDEHVLISAMIQHTHVHSALLNQWLTLASCR